MEKPLDPDCVKDALGSLGAEPQGGEIEISAGNSEYPQGAEVTSFVFGTSDGTTDYVGVAKLPNGKTRYLHSWGRIGASMPPDERKNVIAAMKHVDRTISLQCGVQLTGTTPTENSL